MMTVDWTRWLYLTAAEQRALVRHYKEIVKAESVRARSTNYAAMIEAIAEASRGAGA